MKQNDNTGFRVLARDIAQELTAEEIAQVNGGECKSVAVASWSQQTGADVRYEYSCTNP